MRARADWRLAAVLLLAASCHAPDPPPGSGFLRLDPETIQSADGVSTQAFTGTRASIKLRDGWSRPRKLAWRWKRASRTHERASVYFTRPAADRVEFIASCTPLMQNAGSGQTVEPTLNQQGLPKLTLRPGWQQIRFELPEALLRPGINLLELHAPAPVSPEGEPGPPRRPQTLACGFLAVARQGTPLIDLLAPRAGFDADLRQIELPPGTGLAFPLPAERSLALHLGMVAGGNRAGALALSVRSRQGTRELWAGPASQASGLKLEVADAGTAPAQLVIERLPEPAGERGRRTAPIAIELPDDFLAASAPPPAAREDALPHVFVYAIDTLRADALGIYGSERPSSPRIDRFAADAVVFDAAWSPSPWTLPSTVSVLTGVYPFRHGFAHLTQNPPLSELPATLSERLLPHGYQSVGVSQTWLASARFGIDRGFEFFYLNNALGRPTRESESVRWFLWNYFLHEWNPARPVFSYIHTVEPHHPYSPRGPDRSFAELEEDDRPGNLRALYDGEVLYADRQFGAFLDLLETLGLYDQSLIVLLSDHGEEFREHEGLYHSRTLFQEVLHVPLVMKFPGSRYAGRRVGQRVSTIDVAATVLDLVGADLAALDLDGQSLASIDDLEDREIPVLAETKVEAIPDRLEAVDLSAAVLGDIKCIHSANPVDRFNHVIPTDRSFDLAADPDERQPLDASDSQSLRCTRLLEEWSQRLSARSPQADPGRAESVEKIDEETRRRLEALGYL